MKLIDISQKLDETTPVYPGDAAVMLSQVKTITEDGYNSYLLRSCLHAGTHIDAWGCVWTNIHNGLESIVTGHPLANREDINTFRAPEEDVGLPHGFMYLRLLDLRGFEEAMVDFAEEPPELQKLIDMVCNYNIRQVHLRLEKLGKEQEVVGFGDDLGMQYTLAISPEKFRKYLTPAFTSIYAPVKEAGHFVYMHTDGAIWQIIHDLKDCGVDIINPQYGSNPMSSLKEMMRIGFTMSLDLDRQLMPFASPQELDEHVHTCVKELGDPAGGLGLVAGVYDDMPLENIAALFTAMERYRYLENV